MDRRGALAHRRNDLPKEPLSPRSTFNLKLVAGHPKEGKSASSSHASDSRAERWCGMLEPMKEEVPEQSKSEPAVDRQHLQVLRSSLLRLHKTLVDSERIEYEKTIGKIRSPSHFLQLLTSDPWFAWLSPLSQLIVSIDEALDPKEPLTDASVAALVKQSSELLVASETGSGFAKHYDEALQRDPDVVFAHAEVRKLRKPR
jgi:hypothetical protein